MPNPLEYDEESDTGDGLFGSDDEDNGCIDVDDILPDTRKPVAPLKSSTAASVSLTGASTSQLSTPSGRLNPDQRYEELTRQRSFLEPAPITGPPSFKAMIMRVILQNASRIDDIGGLTYKQMAIFIDQLPRTQLQEVEENCPHLYKDTDWLWEAFLIKEFPLFYTKCRDKGGEPRTSGWRRKFAEAYQEAEERKTKAAARISLKYAEAEKVRQDKKIRLIDDFVAPPKGRRGGHTLRNAKIGKQSLPTNYMAQKQVRGTSAISKARTDLQRTRVALTHASGKYVPPSSRPVAASSTSAYDNPYARSTMLHESNPKHPNYVAPELRVEGPRLPPPRVPKPSPTVAPDADPFPGSRRTDPAARASLPEHIKLTKPSQQERFRIDDYKMTKTAPMRDIRKPEVPNFNPDTVDKPKAKIDFFARPQMAKAKRPPPVDEEADNKRARKDTGEGTSTSPPASARPPPPHATPPAPGAAPSFLLKKKTNRHSGPQRITTTDVEAVKRSIAKPGNRVPRRR
ncbi:hypothetical protein CC85DRAFT_286642 [Cutaneotrichosporon oleaginosum]|uniref:Elongin-A n=1 Tax=Cutaneotrichosporon oleaginosum TaxID=879819 RepID=A0A0J0XJC4_9TREE|nr:uncharacterized protein CC85DRAFT_286642 [Cutaneotrichosporon oleaginosum]KLT41205.1 hypothetical protein CC85DRAFT_286642 [Cutaneotrichosporon oleaginosum]TXT05471.1 hypothetical protein COLE_06791 [Cutaneotrichosporon oleaginosum]